MAHKHRVWIGEDCFKTDWNYISLENIILISLNLQHCYVGFFICFLMIVKQGRNKRKVTEKGNAENGKDQLNHASVIFSSFWNTKESQFALLLESASGFLLAISLRAVKIISQQ